MTKEGALKRVCELIDTQNTRVRNGENESAEIRMALEAIAYLIGTTYDELLMTEEEAKNGKAE